MKKTVSGYFVTLVATTLCLLAAGCATPPETKKEEEKKTETVFYPPLPNPPRIQYLTSLSGPKDLKKVEESKFADFVLGKESQAENDINKPYGVAIHDGKLYVVDTRNFGYGVFDLVENRFHMVTGMKKPINITIDAQGNKYVTDTILNQILVFGPNDEKVRAYGEIGEFKPSDVAILNNKLFVADLKNHQIQVLDQATGDFLYAIGSPGSAEGQFIYPTNIAIGPDDNLYVSDTGNFRVEVFSPEGRYIRKLGEIGTSLGKFARPKGVAVDRSGRIYVVDAAFQNVQVFDPDGRLLMFFADPGSGPGQLFLPTDIYIDYDNVAYFQSYAKPGFKVEYLILITNQFGPHKVNVYGFGKMEGMEYD